MYQTNKKIFSLFILLSGLVLLTAGCGSQQNAAAPAPEPIAVGAQTAADSRVLKQKLEYPAIVSSLEEAKIVAKSAGTVKEITFEAGEKVSIGEPLVKIDDVGVGTNYFSAGYTSAQVRQASIGVAQAQAAYEQASKVYQDLLAGSVFNLKQSELAADQAIQGKSNLDTTLSESLKSAQIAYDTAKVAAEQARLGLEDRKTIAGQSESDIKVNAETTANAAVDTVDAILRSINNMADFDTDNPVPLSYKINLGAEEVNSYAKAQQQYDMVRSLYDSFINSNTVDLREKIKSAVSLVNEAKKLADSVVYMLGKTIVSDNLPRESSQPGAPSLTGLQAAAAGFETQLSGMLAQVNGALQGLTNTGLNNDATLTALAKAYELAQKQEASAKQNLENLQAANKAQTDQAAFGVDAAQNQLANTKINLGTQVAVAKSQLDISELAYRNAQNALQGAYDNHLIVSPISGTVTKKSVTLGQTVSIGEILAVVSKLGDIKFGFYVDSVNLPYFKIGQNVTISSNGSVPVAGVISSVSQSADDETRRFLVEARPITGTTTPNFALGTVVDVVVEIAKPAQNSGTLILPISAVEIGQNANNIMIIVDGKAVKFAVSIVKVEGESVEIKADLPPATQIIVKNNKIVQEGDPVQISNF